MYDVLCCMQGSMIQVRGRVYVRMNVGDRFIIFELWEVLCGLMWCKDVADGSFRMLSCTLSVLQDGCEDASQGR